MPLDSPSYTLSPGTTSHQMKAMMICGESAISHLHNLDGRGPVTFRASHPNSSTSWFNQEQSFLQFYTANHEVLTIFLASHQTLSTTSCLFQEHYSFRPTGWLPKTFSSAHLPCAPVPHTFGHNLFEVFTRPQMKT